MATVARKNKRRGAKWYAVYVDRDGKQKWKVAYTDKTKSLEYARDIENEERAIRLGHVDPQQEARRQERAKGTAAHVESFRSSMEANARATNHVAYSIRDVELCIAFTEIQNANALTRPMIDRWRHHCRHVGYADWRHPNGPTKPDSRKTCNRRVSSVRAWLNHLLDIGAVERNILQRYKLLETKGHEVRHRRALTREEAKALVEKTPDPHRKEIYRFALLTGLRRSEIASMRPASFEFKRGTIMVKANDAKFKGEHQIIPMHPTLREPLKRLCGGKGKDDLIFSIPRKQVVVSLLHADCTAAGVDTDDVDFHSLRHSFITHLAEANVRPEVLQKLARHSDIKTTMRFYVHHRADDERNAMALLA